MPTGRGCPGPVAGPSGGRRPVADGTSRVRYDLPTPDGRERRDGGLGRTASRLAAPAGRRERWFQASAVADAPGRAAVRPITSAGPTAPSRPEQTGPAEAIDAPGAAGPPIGSGRHRPGRPIRPGEHRPGLLVAPDRLPGGVPVGAAGPIRAAMLPRWQTVAERWPTSTSQIGRSRLRMQSSQFWWWFSLTLEPDGLRTVLGLEQLGRVGLELAPGDEERALGPLEPDAVRVAEPLPADGPRCRRRR